MGVKGKGGEKGRNGVGVGPCLHQTMRKEDTLMYPEQSARRVPRPTRLRPLTLHSLTSGTKAN